MRERLDDEKVVLRRPRAEDVPLVVAAIRESITEISAWMSWCHADYGIDDCAAWFASADANWQEGNSYAFLITEPETGVIVGCTGLNQINGISFSQAANLGYWMRSSHTGRGFATAATALVVRCGLAELGLQRIEIVAAVGNTASRRVAEKVGAHLECIWRDALLIHDQPHDAVLYSFVAGDPLP